MTRNRSGNGIKRAVVHLHGAPLDGPEIVWIDNMPVTSLASRCSTSPVSCQ